MRENAVHLGSRLDQLARTKLRKQQMFIRVAIDKGLDLLRFVVRQCRATNSVTSNVPRHTVTMQRWSHVKHWYAGGILRTGRLSKPRVPNEIRFRTILANNIESTERECRFGYAITGHTSPPISQSSMRQGLIS